MGCVPVNTAQDNLDVLCCRGALLAHVQLAAYQDFQDLFHRATPRPVSPLPVLALYQGVPPSQAEEFVFVLLEFHYISCQSIPPTCLGISK